MKTNSEEVEDEGQGKNIESQQDLQHCPATRNIPGLKGQVLLPEGCFFHFILLASGCVGLGVWVFSAVLITLPRTFGIQSIWDPLCVAMQLKMQP